MPESEISPNIKLPDVKELIVSSSPHIHSGENIKKTMSLVILALLPACIAGIFFFGIEAFRVIFLCSFFCMLTEAICCKVMKKPNSLKDMSALLTGILLALNLSSTSPWWLCAIGAILAIVLAKQLYGGIGYNPFNPALVARVGLLIAFPKQMTTWTATLQGQFSGSEALTTATPLAYSVLPKAELTTFLASLNTSSYMHYFLGNIGGCIGETSALAILIGGAFLIYKKLIRWHVPFFYILTVAIISGLLHIFQKDVAPPPLFHVLTGGLFIGAFFMATDMVTSPLTKKGAIIYGIGCGIFTCIIRLWGSYPEGVSFSILFMNACTPLIDRYTGKIPFGTRKKEKK